MLRALAEGEQDVEVLAQMARGPLRTKLPQLRRALEGKLSKSQCYVLGELLCRPHELDAALLRIGERIKLEVENSADPFVTQAIGLLQTISGVGERIARTLVSEIGVKMQQFPTDGHLASWAGMCPGNNESAGKRKSGATTKGSPYLKVALIQAAWAAVRTKHTYLSAQYRRLAKRLGKKKELVAVGHSILVIAYHELAKGASYQELGGDYFGRQNEEVQRKRLIRKLESLGVKVTVELPLKV